MNGNSGMKMVPQVRCPGGWSVPSGNSSDLRMELHFQDLQTLQEIVAGLDRLEERLDRSPIPAAVTQRGYFTPDEDDRVRQGVLAYRNYRFAAYEIIFRYRHYATLEPSRYQLQSFLLAFGAALVLYAKSLKIISFAEHVPMLRAKINEPDMKYELPAGFFDDILACYSQLSNYRALRQGDAFWRAHRREAKALAGEAGETWSWLTDQIRHQRHVVARRLLHVLLQRLRYDWRAFGQTVLAPFRRARRGLEGLLGDRLAEARVTTNVPCAITGEILPAIRRQLQPGDVLLMRNDSRLTAAIVPGFWSHAALFLGGKAELEKLGVKLHPQAGRHWAKLPEEAGPWGLVIEACFPCVQLNPLEKCLQVDHLVVLRSQLPISDIATAMAEALANLGKPYDFEFDFNNSSRVVCTELVYRSYHGRGNLKFTLTKRLGRFTLTGDDIIAQALDGPTRSTGAGACPLNPIALLLRFRDGRPHMAPPNLIVSWLHRIQRGWRPARRVTTPLTLSAGVTEGAELITAVKSAADKPGAVRRVCP